jgi:hypothetical protein
LLRTLPFIERDTAAEVGGGGGPSLGSCWRLTPTA